MFITCAANAWFVCLCKLHLQNTQQSKIEKNKSKVFEEEQWLLIIGGPKAYTWRACYKEDGAPWNEQIAREDMYSL